MGNFSWITIYNKIAHKILEYKKNSSELAEIMYKSLEGANLMYSEEKGSNLDFDGEKRCRYTDIDPISFMNRFEMYSEENRKKLIEQFQINTGMAVEIPSDFNGLPATNPHRSSVIRFKDGRDENDIPNIWELFDIALTGNMENKKDRNKFVEYYNKVISKPLAKFNITMGLFKIRPDIFLNLDAINRQYIKKQFGISIKICPNGEKYLSISDSIKRKVQLQNKTLVNFSHDAWLDKNKIEKQYWIYSPGENAYLWQDCLAENIMMIGWDEVGDLRKYENKNQILNKLKVLYGKEKTTNDALALAEFKKDIHIGDVIIVKKGVNKLIGYGEVTSNYYFDDDRENYKHVRAVKWIKNGEWDVKNISDKHGHPVAMKTLTNLTQYGEYPKKLIEFINGDDSVQKGENIFWLNANPKLWSFSELKIGETIEYTAVNENGNKRRIFKNFQDARKGDIVITYEAHPIKKIVGFGVIEKELAPSKSDGEIVLTIKKTEELINPIDYSLISEIPELKNMEYLRQPQGSLFKVSKDEYEILLDIIRDSNPHSTNKTTVVNKYTKENFLKEVYFDEKEYDIITKLLKRKKNIILQGAPGVGKTYMAKKIAYSIIEKEDENRIKFVQFHQSYSYEDFVEGYKPTETTFELAKGVFFSFCKEAEKNPEDKYCFIIDEINRGNLSKIFGELLMLIESDKRGQKISLAYSKKKFSVPENIYIIGLMNTADRSLAMIDYALRRRFAFYKVKPVFDNNKFKEYQMNLKNDKLNEIIKKIKLLNEEIKEDVSLGEGFEIGHSYFCDYESINDEDIEMIVNYEILPLLEEYWFDNMDKYKEWKDKLNGVING